MSDRICVVFDLITWALVDCMSLNFKKFHCKQPSSLDEQPEVGAAPKQCRHVSRNVGTHVGCFLLKIGEEWAVKWVAEALESGLM